MKPLMLAGALALGLTSPTFAQQSPDLPPPTPTRPPDCLTCNAVARPRNITPAAWIRPVQAEFPTLAASRGISQGRATLQCTVAVTRLLTGCSLVSEFPADAGFGAAALAATGTALVSPRLIDGTPDASRTTFTVRFVSPLVPTEPVKPTSNSDAPVR